VAHPGAGRQVRGRLRDDEHRYFQPPPGQARDVHVHVCQQGAKWERVHLLFRDYLRSSADAREAYAAAKHGAARIWGNDRPAYTEAKSDVILGILDQAEAWAAANGWDQGLIRRRWPWNRDDRGEGFQADEVVGVSGV
jgi:GrpB-like predicted nucleotidyltransferase (UPF0157 family)